MSVAPRRLGKYELLQQLGRGNVGDVWMGRDVALHRDVAIKILHSDLQADQHFMSRFTDAGQRLMSLHHPNLVQIYAATIHRPAESSETVAYIVSEYVDGYTLTDYLQATSHRGIFPSIADIVYIFTRIGAAIDYAHQNGIIHGNIKPSNILLNKQNRNQFIAGEPMLSDVGIAHIVGDNNSISSPQYMSPEQAVGDPAMGSSDIYALGVILYELCTGVVPFRDESSVAVMMQHINTLPTPPVLINSNIPSALSEVILRAMAKDAATRFPRAGLLATAIIDACSINPSQPLTQQALSKSEIPAQNPYPAGTMQSILGVPHPVEYLPSHFARPFQGAAPRLSPATTRPLNRIEPISEPLQSNAPDIPEVSDVSDASAETREARVEPAAHVQQFIPETPDPKVDTNPDTGSSSKHTASKLTKPLASIREPEPFVPPPAQTSPAQTSPRAQETQSIPVTAHLRTTPAAPEMRRVEISPFVQPPLQPLHSSQPLQRPVRTTHGFLNFSDSPLYIVVISLVILLLLLGGAIGANLFLNRGAQVSVPGRVFFQDDALGRDDQLRIEIPNIVNPPDGTNYVAWLQDTNKNAMFLGALPVHGGKISYMYTGNTKHDNLLSFAQGIIITTENVGKAPQNPSSSIVYQARFDDALFTSLRNILYSTPGLPEKQAVAANMFEAIKSINDKAVSIVDSLQNTHDLGLAQRQATRIIELIDGSDYATSSGDRPAKAGGLIDVHVGLISSSGQTGYIEMLDEQLNALKANAGNNSELLQHIDNAKNATTDLHNWVQKMHDYDVQILKAADLASPTITAIALQLKQEAANSYTGRTIPPESGPRPTLGSAGAYQAYTETQYMATLNLNSV